MLNLTKTIVETVSDRLVSTYRHYYGDRDPHYATLLEAGARLLLERISVSDALYHDVEHTILVSLVGQDILRGRLLYCALEPSDWFHFMMALLCHDIGYVRGVCDGDTEDSVVIDESGQMMPLPRGATDAILAPYHVDRGKIAVRERLAQTEGIDAERVARAIELTRFPVPHDSDHAETDTEPGLVRAADLIGQLADPRYPQKLVSLFHEFTEIGIASQLGYENPADLVDAYPKFYWTCVQPYVGDAIGYLRLTSEGRQWIANLHCHVFAAEHDLMMAGPYLGRRTRPTRSQDWS